MAGRGEVHTGDGLFSGGSGMSDLRAGLVPNTTKDPQCLGFLFKMTFFFLFS